MGIEVGCKRINHLRFDLPHFFESIEVVFCDICHCSTSGECTKCKIGFLGGIVTALTYIDRSTANAL